jgi:hypothetical protein
MVLQVDAVKNDAPAGDAALVLSSRVGRIACAAATWGVIAGTAVSWGVIAGGGMTADVSA